MKMHTRPKTPDRIVEIRERRTNRKLAQYNVTRKRLEFRRWEGRASYVPAVLPIDNEASVVYTDTDE